MCLQETSRVTEETRFFKENKLALETRIGNLQSLLNELQKQGVLDDAEREEISKAGDIPIEKNRMLLMKVENKGKKAQKCFYHALGKTDYFLFQDLQETVENQ